MKKGVLNWFYTGVKLGLAHDWHRFFDQRTYLIDLFDDRPALGNIPKVPRTHP